MQRVLFWGRASHSWKFQYFRSTRWYPYYFIKNKYSILILLLETMRQIVVYRCHTSKVVRIHIVVSEWSSVLNLANEEEILFQDECKMVALILTPHHYPQKFWDSLLWQDANILEGVCYSVPEVLFTMDNSSSRRLWVESLSIKEMESWTRCRNLGQPLTTRQ